MTARAVLRSGDGRLRAPWRLLVFGVVALGLVALALSLVALAIPSSERPAVRDADDLVSLDATLAAWAIVLAFIGAHAFVLKFVERRGWDFVWMHARAARPRLLGTGLAIGALTIGAPSALLIATGWLDVADAPGPWQAGAFATAMFLLPAAMYEELMLRGYPLAVLRETLGWRWAIVITSVVFGALHVFNENSVVIAIVVVTVAGVFLGAIVYKTESLWTATAAHFAWNLALAVAFHTAVSGNEFPAGDYRVIDGGPDWATGGAWGPEGGAGAIGGMLIAAALLLRRRRQPREAA
ncbi:MAG TPA: CPBP family intramembrane glutamic endopeptidase [Gemmatimonadaceae bacterium]|nr:CPBP family intramembrane glutamic endopeptidase [Gemmatimonadaceae bacterium]